MVFFLLLFQERKKRLEGLFWSNKIRTKPAIEAGFLFKKMNHKSLLVNVHGESPSHSLKNVKNEKELLKLGLPDWFIKAKTDSMNVHLYPAGTINCSNGEWLGGDWFGQRMFMCNFHKGTFNCGFFEEGDWLNGIFNNGTFTASTWHNGIWLDGKWASGIWKKGVFIKGVFEKKVFLGFDEKNKMIFC
jgi:hypothetical protein